MSRYLTKADLVTAFQFRGRGKDERLRVGDIRDAIDSLPYAIGVCGEAEALAPWFMPPGADVWNRALDAAIEKLRGVTCVACGITEVEKLRR